MTTLVEMKGLDWVRVGRLENGNESCRLGRRTNRGSVVLC